MLRQRLNASRDRVSDATVHMSINGPLLSVGTVLILCIGLVVVGIGNSAYNAFSGNSATMSKQAFVNDYTVLRAMVVERCSPAQVVRFDTAIRTERDQNSRLAKSVYEDIRMSPQCQNTPHEWKLTDH